MNIQIAENEPIRNIETLINEAKSLGLRVVHRPEPVKSNVVNLLDEAAKRRMQYGTSPEAA